ncbi:MAG: hypothetical protein J7M11_05880 [Elusimicrobia bacterium]|nr:hypothetical protein [Elusimicrobiota bacterium]
MNIIEWVIYSVLLILELSFIFGIRNDAKKSKTTHPATFLQSFIFLVILIVFLLKPWSKLHIIWLLPISFAFSFVTIARIPILSRIALFFSYFFAGFLLLGIKLPSGGHFYAYDPDKNKNV